MVGYTENHHFKDEGKTKGQVLFYGVFALLTLGLALYISTFEIPNSTTFSHESLFFAKVLFFFIFMILNAYFVVKTMQHYCAKNTTNKF